jgi:hypothetical protein
MGNSYTKPRRKQIDDLGDVFEIPSFTQESKSYTVCISKNTCTCPSWKYHRKGIPTCKHLDSVRPPPIQKKSVVSYIKQKNKNKCSHFHVISAYLPTQSTLLNYVYARKYNGIRIRFQLSSKQAITRKGGMCIDISSLFKNMNMPLCPEDEDPEFDAELVYKDMSSHTVVMGELTKNNLSDLRIKVFDIIDTSKLFLDRIERIHVFIPDEMCTKYHDAVDYDHLVTVMKDYKQQAYEGIVVRHKKGMYTPGHASNANAFKIKVDNEKHKITSEHLRSE